MARGTRAGRAIPKSSRAIADALGIPDDLTLGADSGGLERIVDYLAARALVLVLDNCEHVVGEAAAASRWRSRHAAPDVRILATSREGLGVPGEHLVAVPPLPPDDALQLFVERADVLRRRWSSMRSTPGDRGRGVRRGSTGSRSRSSSPRRARRALPIEEHRRRGSTTGSGC